jgi:hypothetical protein
VLGYLFSLYLVDQVQTNKHWGGGGGGNSGGGGGGKNAHGAVDNDVADVATRGGGSRHYL